jgi:hypothetical protein
MITFIRDVLKVLTMPCKEHTVLFSRQLDVRLPAGEAAGLRIHVLYCAGCARFRRQIRRVRELSATIGAELSGGEGMPGAARERIERHVKMASREKN